MPPTPMMQQYHDAKASVGDALLLFRMGDFYELFYDDAKTASRKLGLALTSRDKGDDPIPMAGFPHHQLNGYLAKIISAGHRAAICEQVEDPRKAKGLVKREQIDEALRIQKQTGQRLGEVITERGWLDERPAVLEALTSIKRAGADFIITYFALDVARWLASPAQ